METVGDRVRIARTAKGLTQDALARLIGAKGESYVSELESGRIKKGGRLHRIAETLGVSIGWLETGKGDPWPSSVNNSQSPHGSHTTRPDAAILSASYAAVLTQAQQTGTFISLMRSDHMEVLCDAYAMISDGKRIFPGEPDAPQFIAAIKERLGPPGGVDDGRKAVGRHGASGR